MVSLSFHVSNTSTQAGDEIVQFYSEDEYPCSPLPVKKLKDYKNLSLTLDENLSLTLDETKQVSFDLNMNKKTF